MKKVLFICGALFFGFAGFAMEEQSIPDDMQDAETDEDSFLEKMKADHEGIVYEKAQLLGRLAQFEQQFNDYRERYDQLAKASRSTVCKLRANQNKLIAALDTQDTSKAMVGSFEKLTAEVGRTRQLSEIATLISIAWLLVYVVRTYTC
jgi:uncharacterized membrane-anchored protein YhcB (DUF1043 family)